MATEVATIELPRARRIGFYGAVVAALGLVVFGLGELFYLGVVAWGGESAFEAATEPGAGIHVYHDLIYALFAWMLLVSLVVQLRHPERKFGPAVFALTAMATFSSATLLGGIFDPLEIVAIVLLTTIVWLSPARPTARATPLHRGALMATIPIVAGAIGVATTEVGNQLSGVAADKHAEYGHYGLMAAVAVIIVVAALVGSTSLSGYRLVAGLAVAGLIYLGFAAMIFPDQASSLGAPWGVAAIVLGLVYGWAVWTSRTGPTRPTR